MSYSKTLPRPPRRIFFLKKVAHHSPDIQVCIFPSLNQTWRSVRNDSRVGMIYAAFVLYWLDEAVVEYAELEIEYCLQGWTKLYLER